MKTFTIPFTYRSKLISAIKNSRKQEDKMKKDFTPTLLDFGTIKIYLARHFGFCYGVENAIEIAFRTIDENPGKKIYLLSEMIHNPRVNKDLQERGVSFLQDTKGNNLIPFSSLSKDDIVLIPAFGTTISIENELRSRGIPIEKYNTTCPFVEKVWNRSEQIAKKDYTIVIHGKPTHEETRATFSHASNEAASVVVNNMEETIQLAKYITGEQSSEMFYTEFRGRYSPGFTVEKDLQKIGVVNQTTMLAGETMAISDFLKTVMATKYDLPLEQCEERFADTRDTLCYATNDNQGAMFGLLQQQADFAVVVGGYNSSNTSHLVELAEEKLPTYFITDESKIISETEIQHFNMHSHLVETISNYFPVKDDVKILITSGASCPDAVVENVIAKLLYLHQPEAELQQKIKEFI